MHDPRPELSIDEIEPTGVLSCVRFSTRVWTKGYDTVKAALMDALVLGLLDDVTEDLEAYKAEPNDWNLFALLDSNFEEKILRDHGWELMGSGYVN